MVYASCELIRSLTIAFAIDIYRLFDMCDALQQGGPVLYGHSCGDEALRPCAAVCRQPR